jgi:release factor glutamine methyltransferase
LTALTWQAALRRAASLLAPASESPYLDARVLLGHLLQKDAAYLHAHPGEFLTPCQEQAFWELVRRRRQEEPVAYITGEKEFMGLSLQVNPAVLIPRPETECLVEAALCAAGPSPRILDLGTGSGAIALSLAFYLPGARVLALDLSPAALRVARHNARRLGLASRVRFLQADLLPPLGQPFHLVVSNPPYIPTGDLAGLPRSVRAFEPREALDGGPDGLAFYRRLLPPPPGLIAP